MNIMNKTQNVRRIVVRLVLALSLTAALVPTQAVFADANKLYVTPASSQMNINTTFTINVRSYADTDQTVGSANGTVSYNSGLLQVSSISVSGSDYGSPSISQGSGTIGFSASRNPAPSGSGQIFAITFQAKAAGTATVGFNNNSQVNGASTTYSSGVYTITNPNPPPSSQPSSTPKASPKPAPVVVTAPVVTQTTPTPVDTAPQPTPDPTGVIDSVTVDPLYSTSTLAWKVNAKNPTASLTYGPSSSQLDKAASVQKKADGSFTATITGLTPGIRYYYSISGKGDGIDPSAYSGAFITRGFPVILTITENTVEAKNAQVKIGSRSYSTTANGKLAVGLAAGSYNGTITTDTATLTINLTVTEKPVPGDGTAPASQALTYNLTSSPLAQGPGANLSIFAFVGILAAGTVILGIGLFIYINYRRHRFETGSISHNQAPTVIVEDGYNWRPDAATSQDGPQAPPPAPITPVPMQQASAHGNSVYISDEEPLDMFEQAKIAQPIEPQPVPSPIVPASTGQSPNLPHSTTP